MTYIFRAWQRLRRRKGSAGFGLSPWEWPDLDAFERHTSQRFAPWEVEILESLDDLFLAANAPKSDGGE